MHRERRKGLAYSLAFHLLLILLVLFGLPSLIKIEPPIEPTAITVELLPITSTTNVKPKEGSFSEKQQPEEPEPPKEQKKPAPPVKTAQSEPAPAKPEQKPEPKTAEPPPEPKPEPKPIEKKPEEKKPEEKKPEVKKPEPVKEEPQKQPAKKEPPKEDPKKDDTAKKKPKEEDLDAILKAVKDTAQKEKTDKKKEKKEDSNEGNKAISNQYDPNMEMSLSEKDAIMSQLAKCWNPPAGAKDAHNLVVVVNADFGSDGSYIKAELASESRSRYASDSFFRGAADAALRAVRQCSPLKNLPQEKYETWKSMELHFDPRELLL